MVKLLQKQKTVLITSLAQALWSSLGP